MILENLFSSRALQECMNKLDQLTHMRPLLQELEKTMPHSIGKEFPIRLEPIGDGTNNYGLFMLDLISHYPVFERLKKAGLIILIILFLFI